MTVNSLDCVHQYVLKFLRKTSTAHPKTQATSYPSSCSGYWQPESSATPLLTPTASWQEIKWRIFSSLVAVFVQQENISAKKKRLAGKR